VGAAAAAGPLMQAVARGWVTDRVSLTDRVSRETVMDWARRMAWTSSNVD